MSEELGQIHKNAWVAFFVAHGVLAKKIDAELEAAGCVTLDVYDVLLALEEAPGQKLRMSELANRVLVTRSGVTRLVDRLERQMLLKREACPQDRRACHAALTETGLAERVRAWPVYRRAISTHFAQHVSEEEAVVISRVFRRMTGDVLLAGCTLEERPESFPPGPATG